ncbi:hypothetical protein [Serratia marcescens]|uniref:hypothetical protein n=1 Tax=Serratia marcescens TaxID=615 RepID=UPI0007C8FEF9|nr:hypothetical protein [Serratia marcescens]OAH25350.1 morphogenetic protein [Serratia marcescens]
MKERPVIFNGEMVRAILDGRKTQTRRPIKFPLLDKNMGCELAGNEIAGEVRAGNYSNVPFGQVGERLWVRETWAEAGASAPELQLYRANYPEHVGREYENVPPASEIRWTPSIHMPRWASRITLEITAVRVERLNDISEEDAKAEGVKAGVCPGHEHMMHQVAFSELWQSIYGAESWRANPWVWVIEFRRVAVK